MFVPILCFVLSCGIRVASMSSVDSIPFAKRCSHIPMWTLILLIYRDCHANSFPTDMLLFKWIRSFSTSARSILSSSQRCLFHPSPSCLCFPAHPPFFFKDSDFSIKCHFIDGSLSILFRQCSYPGVLTKIIMELQVRHSSFFSSPVVSSQALLIISFPCFNTFSGRCSS